MRVFVRKIMLFLLGCILIAGLLSVLFEWRVKQRDYFFMLLDDFSRQSVQPQVVILGNSIPNMNVKNKYLPDRYYRYTYDGENWRQTWLRAIHAGRIKPGIRYFVIPLAPTMFSGYRDNTEDFYDVFYYSEEADIRSVYPSNDPVFYKNLLASRIPLLAPANRTTLVMVAAKDLSALLTGRDLVRNVIIDENLDMAYASEGTWQRWSLEKRLSVTRERLDRYLSNPPLQSLMAAYKLFLDFCQEQDIQVIGVRYPQSREYQALLDKYDLDAVYRAQEEYPLHAILDYLHLYDDRQEYFGDSAHLLFAGGEDFTRILVTDLEGITGFLKK